MQQSSAVLKNENLEVSILLPGGDYRRSRYDWGGIVEQVTLNGHTFLSREETPGGGCGLGGIGLANVFEWRTTELYDQTPAAGRFPLLGVGLLKKPDTTPFLFTRDYDVLPFQRETEARENRVCIRTLPHLCRDTAAEIEKTFSLEGRTLTAAFRIQNVGPAPIHATEFCHNFFRFDGHPIDSAYRLTLPYTIQPRVRRGQLLVERDACRLGAFDALTQSTAFWVDGWQGLQRHWMRLLLDGTALSVLIEDDMPLCNFYSWNNASAFCPETFVSIDLEPGEELSYTRRYTFQTG